MPEHPEYRIVLTVFGRDGSRRVVRHEYSAVQIGSAESCDIVLESADVDRHHAKVCLDGSRYVVFDQASASGTFVNGRRLQHERNLTPLEDGDRLEIAGVVLCKGEVAAPPPLRKPRWWEVFLGRW